MAAKLMASFYSLRFISLFGLIPIIQLPTLTVS